MGAWSQDTSAALGRLSLLVAYCSNLDLGRTVHLHIGDITPNAAPGSCDPAPLRWVDKLSQNLTAIQMVAASHSRTKSASKNPNSYLHENKNQQKTTGKPLAY